VTRTPSSTPLWRWRQQGPPKRRYPTASLQELQPRRLRLYVDSKFPCCNRAI